MKGRLSLALLLMLLGVCPALALDVWILRHAETMGNVTGNYTEENQNTFSPKGLDQVAAVPDLLKDLHFDRILVSPMWRTQHTILPYLKASGMTAEICPEIEELDCGITGEEAVPADVPRGDPIKVVEEGIGMFVVPEDSGGLRYAPQDRADGLAMLHRAVDLLKTRFSAGQSVLLVTHSCTGGRLMELLLGLPARGMLGPGNAVLSRLRRDGQGAFDILLFNGEALTPLRRSMLVGFDPNLLPGFLNLEGSWRIASGDDAAWSDSAADDTAFIETKVPGGWERDALPDYDGIAWYRLRFDVPAETAAAWGEGRLALIMGSIDDADETFLNGQRIGAAGRFSPEKVTAYDQPRIYEFDPALLQPTNLLAVRVDDWGGGGGIWRGPVAIGPAGRARELDY